MAEISCTIFDGPDKPGMLWSVAYPDRPQTVVFKTDEGAVEAVITEMTELSDGFSFSLRGKMTSGRHTGKSFVAGYCVETRSGHIVLDA